MVPAHLVYLHPDGSPCHVVRSSPICAAGVGLRLAEAAKMGRVSASGPGTVAVKLISFLIVFAIPSQGGLFIPSEL